APAPAPALARPGPTPAPLPLALRLSGGFGDLLLAGRVVEAIRALAGHGPVTAYSDRPELARLALGGRGLLAEARGLRDWPRAAGLRIEIDQFLRFADAPERWRASHPALAELIARSADRIASVRGLVARHPQLDGYWARFNLAAGRRRGDALAWSAGFDPLAAPDAARIGHAAPLTLALDEADAGPRLRLDRAGARWITLHDGFDTSAGIRPGGAVKCWPLGHWEALVRQLRAARPELKLVQIGGPTSRAIPGVDECLVSRIGLGEALWLVKGAALHIDGESGLVHAARALGTPAVVLFGPTDRDFFGYAGNLNLAADVCAPCWWSTPDWMAHCPRGLAEPECMAALAPAEVADAALRRLADDDAARAGATPALPPAERADPTARPAAPAAPPPPARPPWPHPAHAASAVSPVTSTPHSARAATRPALHPH
ncbi:glycosyltransferase family 9 protein, partial [Derxia lacustris]|uniref:glycosyltransferase family 9 protein n=1 Tax=Derxia lacustris TaxID=764842 RepID=UPI00111C87DB